MRWEPEGFRRGNWLRNASWSFSSLPHLWPRDARHRSDATSSARALPVGCTKPPEALRSVSRSTMRAWFRDSLYFRNSYCIGLPLSAIADRRDRGRWSSNRGHSKHSSRFDRVLHSRHMALLHCILCPQLGWGPLPEPQHLARRAQLACKVRASSLPWVCIFTPCVTGS